MAAPAEPPFPELKVELPPQAPPPPEEDEPGDDADTAQLLPPQRDPGGFWSFGFYQSLFDVDTEQVLERLRGSVLPGPGKDFVRQRLRNRPDLYGPFWVCATLSLALAVTGNLVPVLEPPGPGTPWSPRFHHVTVATTLTYGYVGLVPLGVWAFLRWQGGPGGGGGVTPTLLETLCLYGYSLVTFVPTTVLWLVPAPWLRWLLVLLPPLLSGPVLARSLWPPARAQGRASALGLVATALALHTLLALGYKLYFFQPPPGAAPPPPSAQGLHLSPQTPPSTNVSLGG